MNGDEVVSLLAGANGANLVQQLLFSVAHLTGHGAVTTPAKKPSDPRLSHPRPPLPATTTIDSSAASSASSSSSGWISSTFNEMDGFAVVQPWNRFQNHFVSTPSSPPPPPPNRSMGRDVSHPSEEKNHQNHQSSPPQPPLRPSDPRPSEEEHHHHRHLHAPFASQSESRSFHYHRSFDSHHYDPHRDVREVYQRRSNWNEPLRSSSRDRRSGPLGAVPLSAAAAAAAATLGVAAAVDVEKKRQDLATTVRAQPPVETVQKSKIPVAVVVAVPEKAEIAAPKKAAMAAPKKKAAMAAPKKKAAMAAPKKKAIIIRQSDVLPDQKDPIKLMAKETSTVEPTARIPTATSTTTPLMPHRRIPRLGRVTPAVAAVDLIAPPSTSAPPLATTSHVVEKSQVVDAPEEWFVDSKSILARLREIAPLPPPSPPSVTLVQTSRKRKYDDAANTTLVH